MSDQGGVPLADLSSLLWPLLMSQAAWLAALGILAAAAALQLRRQRRGLSGPGEHSKPAEPAARRFLRIALGLLWIVDGALQAQALMPAGFILRVVAPAAQGSPAWLSTLAQPLMRSWSRHPVTADAASVWVQIGLGLLILLAVRGAVARLALWASIAWALVIWVTGEFVGGLLAPGASWLSGAPGAVLVYLLAALLLAAPWAWWDTGRAARLARRSAGAWLLLGAGLQALPWERQWSAASLTGPFDDGAGQAQPAVFRAPIRLVGSWAGAHPVAANGLLIAALTAAGLGLLAGRRLAVAGAAALCLLTWWLAQDFGVLGSLGTDPNSGLPLALLVLVGWPSRAAPPPAPARPSSSARGPAVREPLRVAGSAFGVGFGVGALGLSLVLAGSLLSPADAASVVADSGGGIQALSGQPAPAFTLPDQTGRTVSMAALGGGLVVVTFLDPVCSDECPLIANQLAEADRLLGPQMRRVQIVAIDVNPVFHAVADVAAFTSSHGLSDLPNWHFVAGPAATLQSLVAAYGGGIDVPAVGMVGHPQGIYFVVRGRLAAYLGDGANAELTGGYSATVGEEIRKLLR